MSYTGQAVFELQENDDSFDGNGWLGEVVLKEKLLTQVERKTENQNFGQGFSATRKADFLI